MLIMGGGQNNVNFSNKNDDGLKGQMLLGGGATVFKTVPSITSVYINVAPIVPYKMVIQLSNSLKENLFGKGSHNLQHGTKRT